MTTTLPAWVLDELTAAGLDTPKPRRGRAIARRCPWCGTPAWTGTAWPRVVWLDPAPTTSDGELYAILAGRRTYQVNIHREITQRCPLYIENESPDRTRVYVEHSCHGPAPPVNEKWKPEMQPDQPPF